MTSTTHETTLERVAQLSLEHGHTDNDYAIAAALSRIPDDNTSGELNEDEGWSEISKKSAKTKQKAEKVVNNKNSSNRRRDDKDNRRRGKDEDNSDRRRGANNDKKNDNTRRGENGDNSNMRRDVNNDKRNDNRRRGENEGNRTDSSSRDPQGSQRQHRVPRTRSRANQPSTPVPTGKSPQSNHILTPIKSHSTIPLPLPPSPPAPGDPETSPVPLTPESTSVSASASTPFGITPDPLPLPSPPPFVWNVNAPKSKELQSDADNDNTNGDSLQHLTQDTLKEKNQLKIRNILASTKSQIDSMDQTYTVARGIVNQGLSCFRSCIVQALLTMPSFMNIIVKLNEAMLVDSSLAPEEVKSWREVTLLMAQFLEISDLHHALTNQQAKSRTLPIAANTFIPKLVKSFQRSRQSDNYSSYSSDLDVTQIIAHQEDASEFLTFLLDCLHEECVTLSAMPADEGGDGDGHEDGRDGSSSNSSSSSSITSSDQSSSSNSSGDGSGSGSSADWSTVVKTKAKLPKPIINTQSLSLASFASEASLVSRLFHGVLRQEMIYKMTRRPSVTFERFHCLMLQIATSSIATETNRVTKGNRGPSSRNTPKTAAVTLQQLLSNHFVDEIITPDDGTKITKKLSFQTLPPTLMLQLRRFQYDYFRDVPVKIHQEVSFPLQLTLDERLVNNSSDGSCSNSNSSDSNKSSNSSSRRYVLTAVVQHHGLRATGGHYSTLAKDISSNIWQSFNDVQVSIVSEDEVLAATKTAYILFYNQLPLNDTILW